MTNHIKPYYAVIFTSTQKDSVEGYSEMAVKMEALAEKQDGFMGLDSARNEVGITVSYWRDLDSIKAWKQNSEHLVAQRKGRMDWYQWYSVKICKVEQEYEFGESM